MRRLKNYAIEREPLEKPLLTYRDKRNLHSVEVNAERADEIEVLRERGLTYALFWNARIGYVGLQAFRGPEQVGDLFIQNRSDLEGILGKKGLDLPPTAIAKKLLPYLAKSPPPIRGVTESSEQASCETQTFEIHLDDLKEETQQRYLTLVNGEPAYGPLAILEIEQMKTEGSKDNEQEARES